MAKPLNPETESTTLNTALEIPTLEPATEQEQPLPESTSNPETAVAVEVPALDADAPTEPVAEAVPVVEAAAEAETAPVATEIPAQAESAAVIETPVVEAAPHAKAKTHRAKAEAAPVVEATPVVEAAPVIEAAPEAEQPAAAPQPQAAEPVAAAPAPAKAARADHSLDSMDDFSAALEAFEREQAAEAAAVEAFGDKIVSGTVIKATDKHLVIDVGLKSEGLVPLEQVLDHTGAVKFQPGDVIDVVIEREEPEGGYLASYERAQRLRVWDAIEKAAADKTPMMGTVVSRVKGGVTVDIGLKAFLPGSQLEIRPVRNLDGYIGQQIEVRVIKLNKKRGNVVVSRKEILEEEQNAKRSGTLEQLGEGAVLTGTVKNLTDYGAFVDLGGIDGLLHITDMSWGRLTHPRDLVNVGDEIQVKVLKFDKDKQRVSLGFKQLAGRDRALPGGRACAWPRAFGHRLRRVCRAGARHRRLGSPLRDDLVEAIEASVQAGQAGRRSRDGCFERQSRRPPHFTGHEAVARESLGESDGEVSGWDHRRGPGAQPDRLRRFHRNRGRNRRLGARLELELDQARQASF